MEYFVKKLTKPELDLEGLSCQATPLGEAVVLDQKRAGVFYVAILELTVHHQQTTLDRGLYFVLEEGDFDRFSAQSMHVLQLIRLGSQGVGQCYDSQQDAVQGGGAGGVVYSVSSEVSWLKLKIATIFFATTKNFATNKFCYHENNSLLP